MKKTFLFYAFCFAFSIITSTANIAMAKELTLEFSNTSSEEIYVAICYLQGSDWITEGWWTVEKNAKESFDLTVDASYIYIYAEGEKRKKWMGSKDDPKTKGIPIVDEKFKVVIPEHPKGTGLKTVPFKYVDTKEYSKYTYTFYN